MARAVIAIVLASASVASAESASELQQRGERLAKDGHYSEAIDAFKAAERIAPSAHHACLIALAYTRRELWPQAEIFLADCKQRASASDPLPDWYDDVVKLLADRLAAVNVAAVEITVEPAAHARLSVSSFAPDETFPPRTIHLPPGHHVIVASAPGYDAAQIAIDVADRSAHHVAMMLRPKERSLSPLSTGLVYGGAAAIVAGGIAYGIMGYAWSKLDDAYPNHATEYANYHGMYVASRYATWGLWSLGATLAVAGYVIHRREGEHAPTIAAAPIEHGGLVVVGWRR